MTQLDEIGSVAVVSAICLLLALLLREQAPSTWPRSAVVMAPVAALGSYVAIAGGGSHYLLRFAATDGVMIVLTVVLAALVGAVLRWRAVSWPMTLWFVGCVLLVGVTTLPSASGPPALRADAAESLRFCVTDPGRWLPPGLNRVSRSQVSAEFVPNIALFVPIGLGLVLALASRRTRPLPSPLSTGVGRALVVGLPLLVSVSIETYQAAFTTRVCAPIDVMANTAGGITGGLLGAALLLAVRRPAASTRAPEPPDRPGGVG